MAAARFARFYRLPSNRLCVRSMMSRRTVCQSRVAFCSSDEGRNQNEVLQSYTKSINQHGDSSEDIAVKASNLDELIMDTASIDIPDVPDTPGPAPTGPTASNLDDLIIDSAMLDGLEELPDLPNIPDIPEIPTPDDIVDSVKNIANSIPNKIPDIGDIPSPDKIIDSVKGMASPKSDDAPTFSVDQMIINSVDEEGDEEYGEEDYEDLSDDDIRAQILNTALEYVPTHGWSERAIQEAVQALELSGASVGMFKRGGADMVLHFIEECNVELSEHLAAISRKRRIEGSDGEHDIGKFLEDAMETRLRMVIPYIDSWPQAMTLMAHPAAAQDALEQGANMVDEIWHYAGDTAVDMTWYAKRGILGAVYAATELYMLQDKSPDFQDTWQFMHRRMEDINSLKTAKNSIENAAQDLTKIAGAVFTSIQNVVGANTRSR